jgi:uncharacterized membrane protein YeiH
MFTVVGILVMAIFGGIGGGTTRDILLNEVPGSWTNPWYLILVILAWIIGLLIAFRKGQQFRETTYQIFTAFSLPWYAVVGVEKGLQAGWPLLGAIALRAFTGIHPRYLYCFWDRLCIPHGSHLVRLGRAHASGASSLVESFTQA